MPKEKRPITLSYTIQYGPGGRYYTRNYYPCAYVTDDEYRKIISGVLQDIPLDQIKGIEHVLEETRQLIIQMDAYMNKDGSDRQKPLSKPRTFTDIRLSLSDQEIRKLHRMKDPLAALDRPEEHMKVYRSDGSWVEFISGFGEVKWTDSRKPNEHHSMEANDFLHLYFR